MFVPGKPFQPSLMFVGKARSLPKSDAFERCFTLVGSGLNRKHWTRVKRFVRDKRSSLLQKGSNKFYNIGPETIEIGLLNKAWLR